MPQNASDSVLDSKLKTKFFAKSVRHTRYIQGHSSRERQLNFEETWETVKELGQGTYGVVRLEKHQPPSTDGLELPSRVRAVKKIRKTIIGGHAWNYMKELETITKFSHDRVS